MSATTEFDAGPLTWVKGEIDQALAQARERLADVRREPGELTALRHALTHVHQIAGALKMVGLEGAARFCEEIEALGAGLEKGETEPTEATLTLLDEGLVRLAHYLDALIGGEPDVPLRLYPAFASLAQARGRESTEAELFFPDLGVRAPKPEAPPEAEAPAAAWVRGQRTRYQRGLLAWLRAPDDPKGLAAMHDVLAALDRAQATAAKRTFWWTCGAFVDALKANAVPADIPAKQLCGRIDLQVRRLSEGSDKVAERLLREVLYQVAKARPETPHLREVRARFALEDLLPPTAGEAELSGGAAADAAAAREMLEAVAQAKDAWVKLAAGHRPSHAPFLEAIARLSAAVGRLDSPGLRALSEALQDAAASFSGEGAAVPGEAAAMEVATALLLAEAILNAPARADFAPQADAQAKRVARALHPEREVGPIPAIPALDAMSRTAQEKLAAAQVMREIQGNLREIERVLDAFFRHPDARADLGGLEALVHQIAGALRILDLPTAQTLLDACGELIRALAGTKEAPPPGDLEALAEGLSALGFYIEGLAQGRPESEALLDRALSRFGAAPEPERSRATARPEASLEQDVGAHRQAVGEAFAAWREAPEDAACAERFRRALEVLRQDADLTLDDDLARALEEAASRLAAVASPADPGLAQALAAIAALEEAPALAPSPDAERLRDAAAEVIDAELLQVFLEEAGGVLAAMSADLAALTDGPADRPALVSVRRGFHTLKGSGRMVGLQALGEIAWGIERLLNQWLEEEDPVTPALLGVLREAHAAFAQWVASLAGGGSPAIDGSALLAHARALENGEDCTPPAPEPGAPEARVVEAPSPAPGAPLEAAATEAADVLVGALRVSRALFDIFLNEAASHLDVLERELKLLGLAPDAQLTEEFGRASHTLCGISHTTGFAPLAEVACALELWHNARRHQPRGLEAQELATVGAALGALRAMLAAVAALEAPEPDEDVVERLAALTRRLPQAPAARPEEALPPPVPAAPAASGLEPATDRAEAMGGAAGASREAGDAPSIELRDELDPALVPIFVEEAHDLLARGATELAAWRAAPHEGANAHALERTLHTLKGSARMAGAMRLGDLTHQMESRILEAEAAGQAAPGLFDELAGALDHLEDRVAQLAGASALPAEASVQVAPAEGEATTPQLRVRAEVIDHLANEAGELSISRSRLEGEVQGFKHGVADLAENVGRLRAQLREVEIQAETQMQARLSQVQDVQSAFDPLEFDRFTRLQELTRMLAESVNDVSTVQQNLEQGLYEAQAALSAQARVNRTLVQSLLHVRMVPVSALAERLYRIVRQTAKELGRRVNLEIGGERVEMDRGVLEKMTAPLEHLLRNAIAHGIEAPESRLAAGKPEIGEIRLDARQEGNEIVLRLSDDGAGIDLDAVRAKAESLGLVEAGQAASEAELLETLFAAGFSTATELTQVAGRGIGMDVVRAEVADLGGRIEVATVKGRGTTFTLYLPLTLAVTQTVLIKAAAEEYVVPSEMVEQVQQLKAHALEAAYAAGEVRWGGNAYPFFYLPRLLGEAEHGPSVQAYNAVLLLRHGTHRVAIHVDQIVGNREIVVKNSGPQLARVPGMAGATVMGSGRVVLILNPVLAASQLHAPRGAERLAPEAPQAPAQAAPLILVGDDSLTVRKVTSRLLTREGFDVASAKDGLEALARLQERRPMVMLVDIEMPRMDGFELTQHVRADAQTADIPIIMITSRTAEKHREHALSLGVDAYLGKPYAEEALLEHIRTFVAQGRRVG